MLLNALKRMEKDLQPQHCKAVRERVKNASKHVALSPRQQKHYIHI